MGTPIPKQFLLLAGKPVLQHTLEAFHQYDSKAQLILTLPGDWMDYWQELCADSGFKVPHQLVAGGEERFHSIREALRFAIGDYIAVHDGVRPLIDAQTIDRTFEAAQESGAAIPVVALKDSIRKVENGQSKSQNRTDYVLVQTPQIFKTDLLMKAYELDYHQGITDDASLVESAGYPVQLVAGNDRNMKITSNTDLALAEYLLSENKNFPA